MGRSKYSEYFWGTSSGDDIECGFLHLIGDSSESNSRTELLSSGEKVNGSLAEIGRVRFGCGGADNAGGGAVELLAGVLQSGKRNGGDIHGWLIGSSRAN
jgi:hypothetical protein